MDELYKRFLKSTGVSIDTRSIKGGELFFCIKGERFNGNKFAVNALNAGASYVIVDDVDYYNEDLPMLLVENSLVCLQELSKYHRDKLSIPVIGITGTNGKTTTKELIHAVLSSQFNTLSTNGNFNNHLGVPLTLLRTKSEHEIAVIEMGANHLGEIADLCDLSMPTLGLITNIGRAHLEGFGSYENIIETKTALYHSVKNSNGTLFVNSDDDLLVEKSEGSNIRFYSIQKDSSIQLKLEESEGQLKFQWNDRVIQTQLFGEYNLYNAAAAIAIGIYFKIPSEKIASSLANYKPSNNRSQFEQGENNDLILDAYNANPDSVNLTLMHFSKANNMKQAVILGDMLELGEFEEQEHKKALEILTQMSLNKVFLVGPIYYQMKDSYPLFQFFKDNMDALEYFKLHSLKGCRILLKGSRGIKLEILKDQLL